MPKKPKEKKLSKKQRLKLERERQEALARQQMEEELARQEALRKEREAEKARLLEEKRIRREAELRRLEAEAQEDAEKHGNTEKALKALVKEKWEQYRWKSHLGCSDVQNPRDPKEMNTFLTTWRSPELEEQVSTKKKFDIVETMQECQHAAKLADGLQKVMIESALDIIQPVPLKDLAEFHLEIGHITKEKLDLLTVDLLGCEQFQNVLNAEHEESEFEMCYAAESVEFGLWISNMEKRFSNKKIEFKDCNLTIEIPKELAMTAQKPLACRYFWTQEDYYTPQDSDIKTLGGVMHIEIIEVPEGLKRFARSPWQSIEELTEVIPYDYGKSCTDGSQKITVTRVLPPRFVLGRVKPSLRWWNAETSCWSPEPFGELAIDDKSRTAAFSTSRLHPMCFAYPANDYLNVHSWKIEPTGVERCVLSLESDVLPVKIEIIGSHVRLIPTDPPVQELEYLYFKESEDDNLDHNSQLRSPSDLIQEMRKVGINLWRSAKGCTKNQEVATKAYSEIATIASCFDVCFSRWNETTGSSNCLFQLRKPLTMDEKQNLDEHGKSGWKLMLVDVEKFVLLKSGEHSEELDLETPDDENMQHNSHVSLRRCVDPISTSDIIRNLADTSLQFQENVRCLLNLVQPFQVEPKRTS